MSDKLVEKLWSEVEAEEAERAAVRQALESANSLCRSAMSIAERDGRDTNWESFRARLKESLELQHKVMYPIVHEFVQAAPETK